LIPEYSECPPELLLFRVIRTLEKTAEDFDIE
jgi:hypothetical protein